MRTEAAARTLWMLLSLGQPYHGSALLAGGVQGLRSGIALQEHRIYPESVAALAAGRITWRDDGVPVVWLPV